MKKLVLIITTAFVAGLFAMGQAGASGYGYGGHEKTSAGGSAALEKTSESTAVVPALNDTQIRELQKILTNKGYDIGAIDGVLGGKTMVAIRDFQKSKALAVTGIPDKETLRALAPDAKTQEFFGLAPEFGGKEMNIKPPEVPKNSPEGTTKSIERY